MAAHLRAEGCGLSLSWWGASEVGSGPCCRTAFSFVGEGRCSHRNSQSSPRHACSGRSLCARRATGANPARGYLRVSSAHFCRKTGLRHFWPVPQSAVYQVACSNSLQNSMNKGEGVLTHFAALETLSARGRAVVAHFPSFAHALVISGAASATRPEGFAIVLLE